ncbi:Transposable element Tcb2 transposase, partial [Araneus ventricosus]
MMVHTHYLYSYNSKEALDIAFVSLDPSCTWKVQENIGSDHLPILIELKKRQSVWVNNKKLWNFRRVDWLSFTTFIDNEISRNPLTEDLDTNWNTLKKPLLEERKQIVDVLNSNNSNQDRIELHEVNAELKRKYSQIKRNKWNELCTSLDSRSSNGKLWKLVKNIGKEQPQVEK